MAAGSGSSSTPRPIAHQLLGIAALAALLMFLLGKLGSQPGPPLWVAAEPGAGDNGCDFMAFPKGSRSSPLMQRCGAVGSFLLSPCPSLQAWALWQTTQGETEAGGSPAILAGADSCSCRGSSSLIPTNGGLREGE